MRNLGHVLMWVGFLATAFVSMQQSDQIHWTNYAFTALVGAAGVILLRRTAGADAKQTHVVKSNLATLERTLSEALNAVKHLNQTKDDVYVYDVHGRIDADVAAQMADFADARESMIHGLGLAEYADVMDHFARGERFLNRAWSASADGYINEVWDSLGLCESELQIADNALRRHLGSAAA
jgi:hypothetical protein